MNLSLRILSGVVFGVGAFCWFAFHQNYWRFRGQFNDQGRFFDAVDGVVYHSQSGMIWAGLGMAALLMAAFLWLKIRR